MCFLVKWHISNVKCSSYEFLINLIIPRCLIFGQHLKFQRNWPWKNVDIYIKNIYTIYNITNLLNLLATTVLHPTFVALSLILESIPSPFLRVIFLSIPGVLSFSIPWSSFLLHPLEFFSSSFLGVISFSIPWSPFLLHYFESFPSSFLWVHSFFIPYSSFLFRP